MTNEELARLDQELAARESKLVEQLSQIATKNPDGTYEPKMPNYGDDDEENLNEASALPDIVAMTKELEHQLKEVLDTRDKIKRGAYGTCSNCSLPITPERLRALPTAQLCISCTKPH